MKKREKIADTVIRVTARVLAVILTIVSVAAEALRKILRGNGDRNDTH